MKRIPLLITLLLFLSLDMEAQSTLGIKGGYTDAWPGYGEIQTPEGAETHVNGFNVSLFYFRKISNQISFGTSPGFVQRGAACFPGWQPVFLGDSEVYLNYVEIPIKLKNTINLGDGPFEIETSVGYGLSFLTAAFLHETILNTDEAVAISEVAISSSDSEAFNPIDHGAYLDFSLVYRFTSSSSVFIESGYYHGFSDYDKQNVSKNRSLNFNIGYAFHF